MTWWLILCVNLTSLESTQIWSNTILRVFVRRFGDKINISMGRWVISNVSVPHTSVEDLSSTEFWLFPEYEWILLPGRLWIEKFSCLWMKTETAVSLLGFQACQALDWNYSIKPLGSQAFGLRLKLHHWLYWASSLLTHPENLETYFVRRLYLLQYICNSLSKLYVCVCVCVYIYIYIWSLCVSIPLHIQSYVNKEYCPPFQLYRD